MRLLPVLLVLVATLGLLMPPVLGLHHVGDADSGLFTHVEKTFYTPIGSAIWWDYSTVRGISTGIREYTAAIEVRNTAPVLVTAETFPIAPFVDTPKVCLPATTPEVVVPVVVVHEINCVKENGFTVQVHYFVWTDDPNDPDHISSPSLATPTAELAWRLDLMPLSYKTALIPPGHWQVWFHPAVAPPAGYNIKFTVDTTVSGQSFYYDFLGHRGCPFYVEVAPGINDQDLLGCPNDYEA